MKRTERIAVWLLAGACQLSVASGNGFYVPVQDPFATARGNAWVATADGPAAVYYNPAGLVQLDEPTVQAGVYAVHLGLDAYAGGTAVESDASWQALPQLYAALPLGERWVAGLGVNTPFGLATDWPNAGPFRTFATSTELRYVTGWAVLGYEVSECFSLGGGVGLHHADATLRQGIGLLPGDQFDFTGTGEGFSWMMSARWAPTEQHSFGLVYRSFTDFDLKGRAISYPFIPYEPAALDLVTPATAAIGYAYTPCPEWQFEVDLEWVDWNRLGALGMAKPSGNLAIPFFWDSNLIYSAGVTRYFGDGWVFNAGYNYIENSQPDVTFNPAVADADRHWINLGVGREYESLSWFIAYQYAFSGRQVTGGATNAAGQNANGKYNSRFHAVTASVAWRF